MKLYLMRHGKAVNVGSEKVRFDSDRYLSDEGMERTGAVAEHLARIGCLPKHVYSSPLVRARETAEIARSILCPKKDVELTDEIRLGCDADQACAWMSRHIRSDSLLVGHMPDMSNIVSYLLTADYFVNIVFKTSTVCCVSFDGGVRIGNGFLEWMISSSTLKICGKN